MTYLTILELLLLLLGFALLSFSLHKHYALARPDQQRLPKVVIILLRVAGYGILLSTALWAMHNRGAALGLVYWFGSATITSLLLSQLLAYRPLWSGYFLSLVRL